MKFWILMIMQGKMVMNQIAAEFISAIAAENNAHLMMVVSDATSKSTTLGLVAAAEQTGVRWSCN